MCPYFQNQLNEIMSIKHLRAGGRFFPWRWFAMVVLLAGLSVGCQQDDPEDMTPTRNWRLTYSLTSVGEININRLTYRDEFGADQTVPGERDFSISLEAETGFPARFIVEATAINGGTIARIEAVSLDGAFEEVFITDDDGNADPTPKDFTLVLELTLP